MLMQILTGGVLITMATATQVFFLGIMMISPHLITRWMARVSLLKVSVFIGLGALWMIVGQLAGTWIWSLARVTRYPDPKSV